MRTVRAKAALVGFADDLLYRGQRDVGGCAFQPFRCVPGGFRPGKGYGMTGIGLDPGADFCFIVRAGIAVKPGQQARGFRLDRVPARVA